MKKTLFVASVMLIGSLAFGARKAKSVTLTASSNLNPCQITLGSPIESTFGFADLGKMAYPDSSNVIVIDDKAYPNPIEKRKAFTNAIASGSVGSDDINDKPAVILLSGTVDLSDGKINDKDHSYYDEFDSSTHKRLHNDIVYEIGANKTILGVEKAKVAFGGVRIKARDEKSGHDIIIRNIAFWDAHGSTEYDTSVSKYSSKKASADQLSIEGTPTKGSDGKDTGEMTYVPTNIWIDHCSFSDGTCRDLERNYNHDGALDAKAVRNMTVSYCEFTNHDKVTLLGPSDKFVNPNDRTITFHHNYYHGAIQRMPRSRGCKVHIYNNVYDSIGTSGNSGYSLGPGIGSLFIVESNYFGSHAGKILRYNDKSDPSDSTFSKFYTSGNSTELNSSNSEEYSKHHTDTKPFDIPYAYSLDDVSKNKSELPGKAGNVLLISVK
ncbi:MAG: polysaccharide lyase family 1 protein [Treponema sp.]|nr:polysaccharide lyase family 1 protein [Treponema sp.]